ncbi:hypothetical protein GQR58_025374 [Nymphon striatum]|nr:hypothetical protein GQR58_025374 [Nymphon striatum]
MSSGDSPGMDKNTLSEVNASKEGESVSDERGEIKSVGVKTTINTSFRIAQKAAGDSKSSGSTKIKNTARIGEKDSSISRSRENQSQKNDQKLNFNLKDLEVPIAIKNYKLNLSSPINITNGNYTITFFGKPSQKNPEKTDASKLIPPTQNSSNPVNISGNPSILTTAPPASPTNETLSTLSSQEPPRRTTRKRISRWPLNRRRKVSTARRFLLRTRKPIPTRRNTSPPETNKVYKTEPVETKISSSSSRGHGQIKYIQEVPDQADKASNNTSNNDRTYGTLTADNIKSSGAMKLEDGIQWTNSLADKNSKEFKTLALDLKVLTFAWKEIPLNFEAKALFSNPRHLVVKDNIKGSVVVDFDVVFKRAIANRIKAIHLKKILIDTLNRDGGKLGVYTVNETSFFGIQLLSMVYQGSLEDNIERNPVDLVCYMQLHRNLLLFDDVSFFFNVCVYLYRKCIKTIIGRKELVRNSCCNKYTWKTVQLHRNLLLFDDVSFFFNVCVYIFIGSVLRRLQGEKKFFVIAVV